MLVRFTTSSRIARSSPQHISSMITVNGSALARVAACSAPRPPASSSAMATTPSSSAQKIRCHTGDCSSPLEVSMSTTSDPESDEVTKNSTTSSVATVEVTAVSGSSSRNRNSATEVSAATASDSAVTPSIARSEEHTSELQSRPHLVCRLLLEKKKKKNNTTLGPLYNQHSSVVPTPAQFIPDCMAR